MSKRHAIMSLLLETGLKGYLTPKLAMDANLNLRPIVKGVTTKNYQESKGRIRDAVTAATQGKLAQDASLADLTELLDALDDNKEEVAQALADDLPGDPAGDPVDEEDKPAIDADEEDDGGPPSSPPEDVDDGTLGRLMEFLKAKLSDEDLASVQAIIGDDGNDTEEADSGLAAMDKDLMTKPAMDAAIQKAVKNAETAMVERQRTMRVAEREVHPFIGEIAMDSASAPSTADQVYKMALDAASVDTKDVPPAAFRAMVKMLPRPGAVAPEAGPQRVAMDAAAADDYTKRYGPASHLKRR